MNYKGCRSSRVDNPLLFFIMKVCSYVLLERPNPTLLGDSLNKIHFFKEVRKVSRLKTSGFAKILDIAKEDSLSKYRKQLIDTLIRVNWLGHGSRASPWFSDVSAVLLKGVCLNGVKIKKGESIWFCKVKLQLISRI